MNNTATANIPICKESLAETIRQPPKQTNEIQFYKLELHSTTRNNIYNYYQHMDNRRDAFRIAEPNRQLHSMLQLHNNNTILEHPLRLCTQTPNSQQHKKHLTTCNSDNTIYDTTRHNHRKRH